MLREARVNSERTAVENVGFIDSSESFAHSGQNTDC